MIVLGHEQMVAHSNLFTYYDMTKSITCSLIIIIMFINDSMNVGRL